MMTGWLGTRIATALALLPLCLFLAECIEAFAFPFHGAVVIFVGEAFCAALGIKACERLAVAAGRRWGPRARIYVLAGAGAVGMMVWVVAKAVSAAGTSR